MATELHHSTHCTWTAQHWTAQHWTAQQWTAQQWTAQHWTAQHWTAQHWTAQHWTAQHSTAQHSTAQHWTAQPWTFGPAQHISTLVLANCACAILYLTSINLFHPLVLMGICLLHSATIDTIQPVIRPWSDPLRSALTY